MMSRSPIGQRYASTTASDADEFHRSAGQQMPGPLAGVRMGRMLVVNRQFVPDAARADQFAVIVLVDK